MHSKARHRSVQSQIGTVHQEQSAGSLSLPGLTLIGVGGIIGAGYFLGVGLAISQAGPAILLGFILGAAIMSQVLGAVMSLSVNHPVQGSFRVYAEEMFGPFLGYFQGWLYWVGSILTVGSEAVAMSVFVRFWVPSMPVWLLALLFTVAVVVMNAFGTRLFAKLESILAVLKILALLALIATVALAGIGLFARGHVHLAALWDAGGFWPHGIRGVLQSMPIVVFAYAGIGVMATAATQLRKPDDAGKAAIWTVIGLLALYLASLFALLITVRWTEVSVSSSPFVKALTVLHVSWLTDAMNAIIAVAAFTVMAGAVFSAVLILQNMSTTGEAPAFLRGSGRRRTRMLPALAVSGVGAIITIGIAWLLPAKVYSYLVSASSYFTFFNWIVILLSWLRYKSRYQGTKALYQSAWLRFSSVTIWITILLIVGLFVLSLGNADQRLAAIAAAGVAVLVALPYRWIAKRRAPS